MMFVKIFILKVFTGIKLELNLRISSGMSKNTLLTVILITIMFDIFIVLF